MFLSIHGKINDAAAKPAHARIASHSHSPRGADDEAKARCGKRRPSCRARRGKARRVEVAVVVAVLAADLLAMRRGVKNCGL